MYYHTVILIGLLVLSNVIALCFYLSERMYVSHLKYLMRQLTDRWDKEHTFWMEVFKELVSVTEEIEIIKNNIDNNTNDISSNDK